MALVHNLYSYILVVGSWGIQLQVLS